MQQQAAGHHVNLGSTGTCSQHGLLMLMARTIRFGSQHMPQLSQAVGHTIHQVVSEPLARVINSVPEVLGLQSGHLSDSNSADQPSMYQQTMYTSVADIFRHDNNSSSSLPCAVSYTEHFSWPDYDTAEADQYFPPSDQAAAQHELTEQQQRQQPGAADGTAQSNSSAIKQQQQDQNVLHQPGMDRQQQSTSSPPAACQIAASPHASSNIVYGIPIVSSLAPAACVGIPIIHATVTIDYASCSDGSSYTSSCSSKDTAYSVPASPLAGKHQHAMRSASTYEEGAASDDTLSQDRTWQLELQQQQQLLVRQLYSQAVTPASAAAVGLVGRWWHQEDEQLSDLLLRPDGTLSWVTQSSDTLSDSSNTISTNHLELAHEPVQEHYASGRAEWAGIWQLMQGNAAKGQLQFKFIEVQCTQHGMQEQQSNQQALVVQYQRHALDDAILFDGFAHVRIS